ncbi:MAG: FMN-binding protein [Clostridium sp.]
MKKILIIGIVVIVIGVSIIGYSYYRKVTNYKKIISEMKIEDINLNNIENGVYEGEFDAEMVSAKVKVEVKNKSITNIEILEHNNGKGKPGEGVIQKIIDKQSLNVDVVSGATSSSKVLMKSVENALSKR